MMNAIVLEGLDQPFALKKAPKPEPGAGEVLVQLKAAALNHRDAWIRKGKYAGLKFPIIPGSDGAGILVGSGKEVIINPSLNWGNSEAAQGKDFKILGLPDNGTFAEFVCVPESAIHPKPSHLTWEQAAALPLAGLTAYRAVFSRGMLKPGEKVLVSGIGGGVALFALEFSLSEADQVYVTSGSQEKLNRSFQLGANGGVNYKNENWVNELKEMAGGFDLIIDGAGGAGASRFPDLCNPGGRIVMYGGTRGAIPELSPQKLFWKQISLLGSTMGSPKDFSEMLDFVNRTKIHPTIDSEFPLEKAEAAIAKMEAGEQFGKIVLGI